MSVISGSGGYLPQVNTQPAASNYASTATRDAASPSPGPVAAAEEIEHIHQGEGSPWTAQGLGYDEAERTFFTTYYRDDPPDTITIDPGNNGTQIETANPSPQADLPNVRLSVQDRVTGAELPDVYLAGPDGRQELSKGGGVAVAGEYVYVADSSQVYVYRRDDIYNARPGQIVEAVRVNEVEEGSASYINIHDGKAYVGRWVENHPWQSAADGDPEVHVYQIDPETGRFVNEGGGYTYNVEDPRRTSAAPLATIQTPYNVQGIAVDDDGIAFSASFGDFGPAPSDLIWQDWSDRSNYELSGDRREYDVPDYNEGIQIVDGEIFVATEEGAEKYDGEGGLNEIRRYDLDDVKEG
ncbi:hypothetical protein [Lysobacter sp. CA199]|uniref:hypothetical protein n=1 Tax=Lysobacter sp. CA199 TaxID=3455608 RepID=UPI003F8D18A2